MRGAEHPGRLWPEDLEETNRICRRFIQASVLYFFAGFLLGLLSLLGWRVVPSFVDLDLNFFGWISMMIFGVGYKLLPNYTGKISIHSLALARLQFWLSNLGFLGLLAFYTLWLETGSPATWVLAALSAAVVVGAVALFGLNVWFTFRSGVSSGRERSPVRDRGP